MGAQQSMTRAYLKYFLALLLFGLNGIVASFISLTSYEIVFFRALIGSVFLIGVFILSKGKIQAFKNKGHFAYLIGSGLVMGISWMFLYEAYATIGVSVATLACYCGPVIVMALSPLVFHERLGIWRIVGFCVVVLGMFLVNQTALQLDGISWGLVCGVLAAVLYAVMVIFNKKARSITGLENAMFQLVFSFIAVAVFLGIKQGLVFPSLAGDILPILCLGLVNTGVGCYLYFSSIQILPAASVAVCGYLEPLAALAFAALFLGERLTTIQILGAALMIGGAVWAEWSGHRSMPKKQAVIECNQNVTMGK